MLIAEILSSSSTRDGEEIGPRHHLAFACAGAVLRARALRRGDRRLLAEFRVPGAAGSAAARLSWPVADCNGGFGGVHEKLLVALRQRLPQGSGSHDG